MNDFQLDDSALGGVLRAARERALTAEVATLVAHARDGNGLEPDQLAVLWFAPHLTTEALYNVAREVRAQRAMPLETFSPLYMTNTCDAECRMCGMRRDNAALVRETATAG